jgi:rare lipoprotein A (peptidoglycan hydrolase)
MLIYKLNGKLLELMMKKLFILIVIIAGLVFVSKSYSPARGDVKAFIDSIIDLDFMKMPGDDFRGIASYYGNEFVGRKTSSGELFYQFKMTAAHKTFPLGTMVKVTNLDNRNEVIVRINDRGPFKAGRVIDLTRAAAVELDMIREGTAEVKLEVLK